MRRKTRSKVVSIYAPPANDPEADVLYAYDARKKLQSVIVAEKQRHEVAELEQTKSLAREISSNHAISVDTIIQRYSYRKAAGENAKQQSDVLDSVLSLMEKRYEQLKAESADIVTSSLNKRIEVLEKDLAGKKDGDKGLEEEIRVLRTEVSKLSKASPKKTDQQAAKT